MLARPPSQLGFSAADAIQEAPTLRLALLKGFELTRDGLEVELPRGTQHLLAYLALHERATPRARVAGVLWANVTDDRAAGNLRSALWRLRQAGLDILVPEGDCLSLSGQVTVDVREADRIARQVMNPGADVCDLEVDILPLAGDLLPDWYDDWVVVERERLRQVCLHVLEILCERWSAAGHFAKAVMAGIAAVSGDPLRESAHRALISAYLAEGNQVEAIRQYQVCCRILRAELRVSPSAQMASLVKELPDITLA
jgi:DNA-binding SARP family transcriptional activator